METNSTTNIRNPHEIRNNNTNILHVNSVNETLESNHLVENLEEEGCEYYLDYLNYHGLANDKNLVIIPSSHHYYYDAEDLENVTAVVNLKQLNFIKEIKEFLATIHNILPQTSYLIGSFVEGTNSFGIFSGSNNYQYQITGKVDPVENDIISRIPLLNMIYDLMDSRTNRFLTRKAVKTMLAEAGLRVEDMTELNGLTYFIATKVQTDKN
jgi:hypothetical protein